MLAGYHYYCRNWDIGIWTYQGPGCRCAGKMSKIADLSPSGGDEAGCWKLDAELHWAASCVTVMILAATVTALPVVHFRFTCIAPVWRLPPSEAGYLGKNGRIQ